MMKISGFTTIIIFFVKIITCTGSSELFFSTSYAMFPVVNRLVHEIYR